jgi:hypothetical protein
MERVVTAAVIVGVALWCASASFAASDNTRPAAVKGVNLAGKVSADGKKLVTDDDNSWIVSNPEVLKGFENRYITVKCRIDPDKHALRIMSVETRGNNEPRLHDAAFRR